MSAWLRQAMTKLPLSSIATVGSSLLRAPVVSVLTWNSSDRGGSCAIASEAAASEAIEAAESELWEVPYLPIDPKDVGRTYEAIIRVARDEGCDLIFMASHGRRGMAGLILGKGNINQTLTLESFLWSLLGAVVLVPRLLLKGAVR